MINFSDKKIISYYIGTNLSTILKIKNYWQLKEFQKITISL